MTCEFTPARLRPDSLETVCKAGWGSQRFICSRGHGSARVFWGLQGEERFLSGCTEALTGNRSSGPSGARVADPRPGRVLQSCAPSYLAPPCMEPGNHHLLS